MKRRGKITVTYSPPERSFDLLGGWVELWEHGRYLGLIVGLAPLERYITARPGRVFVVRFVQRETCGQLMPLGSFAAEAAPAGCPAGHPTPVRYFPLDELRRKAKKGGKS